VCIIPRHTESYMPRCTTEGQHPVIQNPLGSVLHSPHYQWWPPPCTSHGPGLGQKRGLLALAGEWTPLRQSTASLSFGTTVAPPSTKPFAYATDPRVKSGFPTRYVMKHMPETVAQSG